MTYTIILTFQSPHKVQRGRCVRSVPPLTPATGGHACSRLPTVQTECGSFHTVSGSPWSDTHQQVPSAHSPHLRTAGMRIYEVNIIKGCHSKQAATGRLLALSFQGRGQLSSLVCDQKAPGCSAMARALAQHARGLGFYPRHCKEKAAKPGNQKAVYQQPNVVVLAISALNSQRQKAHCNF